MLAAAAEAVVFLAVEFQVEVQEALEEQQVQVMAQQILVVAVVVLAKDLMLVAMEVLVLLLFVTPVHKLQLVVLLHHLADILYTPLRVMILL
jgi:hypothetical protein